MTKERLSEEIIDDVRNRFDIVDIISRYMELKKKGRTYFGLCPFHSEKTPSFAVSPDKQIYHCFGCGAGGNLYSFLMHIEGWNFIEAVKKLADEAGINLPIQEENSETINMKNRIIQAHELAGKFYHYILMDTDIGQDAVQYLQNRGFSKETIIEFQLGFAPNAYDTLLGFLKKRGFSEEELFAGGLLSKNQKGTYYDRFRNRVMFPIWDSQGQVIAFGGRILGNGEPKYLNTSDTPIFNKSRIVYNLHRARSSMRAEAEVMIMEGYVDVIAAHQKGIPNAIATLGTALTDEQAKIIRRNVERAFLVYDGDEAGRMAAIRGAAILESANLNVAIVALPDQHDPDDFFQKHSLSDFQALKGQALSKIQLQIQLIRQKYSLDDGEDKVKYALEVVEVIADVVQAPKRDYLLQELSREVNLSIDSLRDELEKRRNQQKKVNIVKNLDKSGNNRINNGKHSHNQMNSVIPAYQKAEREILWIMIHNLEQGKMLAEKIRANFQFPEHSLLAARIYSYYQDHTLPSITKLLDDFQEQPEVIRVITSMQFQFEDYDIANQQNIKACLQVVERRMLEAELKNLQNELERATKTGKQDMIVELLMRIQEIQKKIKILLK